MVQGEHRKLTLLRSTFTAAKVSAVTLGLLDFEVATQVEIRLDYSQVDFTRVAIGSLTSTRRRIKCLNRKNTTHCVKLSNFVGVAGSF